MKQIVAATDFSMRSQRALRRAGLLARQSGAALTLVHIVDDDQPDDMVRNDKIEAEKFLREQAGTLAELRDLSCRIVVGTGEAFVGILEAARESSADVIVMGTHRKQVLRDIFVGTTIERIIRDGSYPVLMVNTPVEQPYRHVLAAVDMSECSANALKTAQTLGLSDMRDVTLVHAFVAIGKGPLYVADASDAQVADYVVAERHRSGQELSGFLAARGIRTEGWTYRVEEGEPFAVISRAALETSPDLVVIGTHGRSAIVKAFLGSVAEEVLRSLNIDILTVPPARPAR